MSKTQEFGVYGDTFARAGIHLPAPLRTYQWQGVRFLVEQQAACLADEMGLGKTVQAAVALQILAHQRNARRILIVCPTSLLPNWARELSAWAPKLRFRCIQGDATERRGLYLLPFQAWIASYEQVREDIPFLQKSPLYHVVLLDEAQRIKNPLSQTAVSCRLIPRARSWVLTGTPLENRLDDLVSVFSFVKRGLISANLSRDELIQRIGPFFLRRRKSEVLSSLPPITYQDLFLELSPSQRAAYLAELGACHDQIQTSTADKNTAALFSILTRLKLLCNFAADSDESSKLDALQDIVTQLDVGERLVVFSQFVDTLRRIGHALPGDLPVFLYHGILSTPERETVLSRFRAHSGPSVLLMSLRAGGLGINLNEASTVVLFDRWWNPAVEEQAIQRAHRFGRTQPLLVLKFLTVNTIEERINDILSEKRYLIARYIEDIESAPPRGWTYEDFMRLLRSEFSHA